MRVVVQNDPTQPDNMGHIVTHLGMNLDQRLKEFKYFENDDQAFWDKVIGGEEPEVPQEVLDGTKRLRAGENVVVHGETLEVSRSADGKTFEMGYRLFDELRRGANRFDDKARASSRKKKRQAAYTNLLTRLDRTKFPLKLFERTPDDLAEVIGETIIDAGLSEKDRAAVVSLARATARKSQKNPARGARKAS